MFYALSTIMVISGRVVVVMMMMMTMMMINRGSSAYQPNCLTARPDRLTTRQRPQTTPFQEGGKSQSGIEPRSFRLLLALRLNTARSNRLTTIQCPQATAFKRNRVHELVPVLRLVKTEKTEATVSHRQNRGGDSSVVRAPDS